MDLNELKEFYNSEELTEGTPFQIILGDGSVLDVTNATFDEISETVYLDVKEAK